MIELLAAAGRDDVLVFVGGIIPDADIAALEAAGVARRCSPRARRCTEIAEWLRGGARRARRDFEGDARVR